MALPEHRITKEAVKTHYKRVKNAKQRLYDNIPLKELRDGVSLMYDYREKLLRERHTLVSRYVDSVADRWMQIKEYFADVRELDNMREQLGELTFDDYLNDEGE